jgi:hypothetical protein
MKWGRYYEIRIKTPEGELITIKPPITFIMEVSRDMRAQVNNASLTLYNLAPETRNRIYKDLYTFTIRWQISIVAGYGQTELYELFRGNIEEAYSLKQGTEWITTIKAYDGSWQIHNGFVNETMTKDVTLKESLKRIIHTMPDMLTGVLGSPSEGENKRGNVVVGNSYDVMQELTDKQTFIDGEAVYVMSEEEVLKGDAFVLESDLNFTTPKRRDTYLELDTLFSPEIRVGHIAEVRSLEKRYDGQYKVYGIKHAATFSEAIRGDAITTVSLNVSSRTFVEVENEQP